MCGEFGPGGREAESQPGIQDIIDDIKAISRWDDHRYLNSSCTLDEDRFWQEYVLKKEKDEYLWLEPVVYLPFKG